MKVAMYNVTTNVVKGGIETFCVKVSEELLKRGIDVRVVCGAEGKEQEIFEKNGVRYHTFPFKRREEFPDFGTRFRKLCKRLSFARNCLHFLREEDFDIIHVHKPFEFPVMYYLKKGGTKSKIIFGSHGTDFFLSDRFFFKRVVDESVVCSRYNAKEVEERFGVKPIVVYNGADEKRFRPLNSADARRRCGLKEDGLFIGTVGRLVGWKGIQVLLKAVLVILESCPEARLLIIGDGEYRISLERLTETLGIKNVVSFVGGVAHDILPLWMNSLDIMVQPSIGDEAFGVTIVEAMACGKPVVATQSGGIPEIVKDGENGFIVPKHSEKLLAEKIITLLKNRDMTVKMGLKARGRVEAEFTWGRVVSRLTEVYRKVLDDNPVIP